MTLFYINVCLLSLIIFALILCLLPIFFRQNWLKMFAKIEIYLYVLESKIEGWCKWGVNTSLNIKFEKACLPLFLDLEQSSFRQSSFGQSSFEKNKLQDKVASGHLLKQSSFLRKIVSNSNKGQGRSARPPRLPSRGRSALQPIT